MNRKSKKDRMLEDRVSQLENELKAVGHWINHLSRDRERHS